MHSRRQALLYFGMQAYVVHEVCEIDLARLQLIDNLQCLKNRLVSLVRLRVT